MSASTTMTVVIPRPVEDVFAVLSDVENAARWSLRTIEETLLAPGRVRKGSRRRAVIETQAGRTMHNEAEMVEFEQNRHMGVKSYDAPVPIQINIDFTSCRRRHAARLDPEPSRRAAFLAPTASLIARFYRMAFEKDLKNLKALMDRGEL